MNRIFDCFIFFNEIELLKFRLKELDEFVDHFIIVESTMSFSGKSKKLYFKEYENELNEYKSKIIYVSMKFDDHQSAHQSTISSGDSRCEANEQNRETFFRRESLQRNTISEVIQKLNNNNLLNALDLIMLSDVDEIPSRNYLKCLKEFPKLNTVEVLMQKFYYYNFHCQNEKLWPGTLIATKDIFLSKSAQEWRDIRCNVTKIVNSGYHLSYFFGVDRIITKVKNFSHDEFNNGKYLDKDKIKECIKHGKDLFDRNEEKWMKLEHIDEANLPKHFKDLIV